LQRFSGRKAQIHLYYGDSPAFLRDLADDKNVPKSGVFFYLDAHVQDSSRYHKAPLVEELDIVFSKWTDAVVMVDDFQVPGMAYGFDDWGPGRTLNLECLHRLKHLDLYAFFPAIDANQDTGAKRGWVVICRNQGIRQILQGINKLRYHPLS
jgi:hypothetical protein